MVPATDPIVVLANGRIPDDAMAALASYGERLQVVTNADLEQCPSLVERVEVVYGWLDNALWARAAALRWVQTTGAGVNSLLTPEVLAHPALVTNARIHGQPIAEHLFGMLLMLTRGLHTAYRQQLERRWDATPFRHGIPCLAGATLGILGLGAIGSQAARVGAAFGMRVLGLRNRPEPVEGVEALFTPDRKHQFLSQCDYVMSTLPLTDDTRCFIAQPEFALMREGAMLLNIGRGGTVDTDALVAALRSGKLGGAGLDVTDPEPLPPDHPLWDLPNVIITPHYAGLHAHYSSNAAAVFLRNLGHYIAGEPLQNVVGKSRGY